MANQSLEIDGFTIIAKLGTGARTTIYKAKDDTTKQYVALKRAIYEGPEDSRIFEQMQTEYSVTKNLKHPYLRKCYKLIRRRKMLKVTELFLSMEFFDGTSLEDSPALSMGDVLLIFRMVATALNAMHQKGYVHCDIKPNNILIGNQGAIKIIDLGQSCKIGTIKKRIQGTPDYIAPEQVKREPIGHRTDIFNLGATMYWALTGKNVPTLIPQKNDYGISVTLDDRSVTPPHKIFKKIPQEVSHLVMECISEKPSERPASMSEIVTRLDGPIRKIFRRQAPKKNESDS